MRIHAAIVGELRAIMTGEIAAAERAVTAGIRTATTGLKMELRQQVISAGMGRRLGNTWRGEVYPKSGMSIAAAGFVWTKAPDIISLYATTNAVIRSAHGWYLAIPLQAAGKFGDNRQKITPGAWERIHGMRLRFVYRRSGHSLLVADNVRMNSRGRAARNVGSTGGRSFTRLSGRTTIPIFVLVPQVRVRKRLDIEGPARRWQADVPNLIAAAWRD